MTLKVCNLQGVTDALFREFLSQPGERQWCSEILRSITKGEWVETKDLLKLPSDTASQRGSPRGSPVNSPRNHAHLSPLLLPPSPRSPLSPLQPSPSSVPTTIQSHVPRSSQSVSPPTYISTPTSSSSSTFSVAFSSITRSFSASLANEARPSTPLNSFGRKHVRRRPGGVGSGARASEAAAGGGAATGGHTCPVVWCPESSVCYMSSDPRLAPWDVLVQV